VYRTGQRRFPDRVLDLFKDNRRHRVIGNPAVGRVYARLRQDCFGLLIAPGFADIENLHQPYGEIAFTDQGLFDGRRICDILGLARIGRGRK
jgi:hypothetical protein